MEMVTIDHTIVVRRTHLNLLYCSAEITKLPTFRKRMISLLPKLGYLDRPIDEQERLFAEAFVRGGAEAETVARADWKTKQAEKRVNEMNEFKAWQQEQKRLREQVRV